MFWCASVGLCDLRSKKRVFSWYERKVQFKKKKNYLIWINWKCFFHDVTLQTIQWCQKHFAFSVSPPWNSTPSVNQYLDKTLQSPTLWKIDFSWFLHKNNNPNRLDILDHLLTTSVKSNKNRVKIIVINKSYFYYRLICLVFFGIIY